MEIQLTERLNNDTSSFTICYPRCRSCVRITKIAVFQVKRKNGSDRWSSPGTHYWWLSWAQMPEPLAGSALDKKSVSSDSHCGHLGRKTLKLRADRLRTFSAASTIPDQHLLFQNQKDSSWNFSSGFTSSYLIWENTALHSWGLRHQRADGPAQRADRMRFGERKYRHAGDWLRRMVPSDRTFHMLQPTNYSFCICSAGLARHCVADQPKGPINPEKPITGLMSTHMKGHGHKVTVQEAREFWMSSLQLDRSVCCREDRGSFRDLISWGDLGEEFSESRQGYAEGPHWPVWRHYGTAAFYSIAQHNALFAMNFMGL